MTGDHLVLSASGAAPLNDNNKVHFSFKNLQEVPPLAYLTWEQFGRDSHCLLLVLSKKKKITFKPHSQPLGTLFICYRQCIYIPS